MKFAKRVFAIATIYGFITLVPMYFIEGTIARNNPPAITHPEYFYGFLGIALSWQVLFLIISRDPVRYRMAMIRRCWRRSVSGAMVLYFCGRLAASGLFFALADLIFAVLFAWAFLRTRRSRRDSWAAGGPSGYASGSGHRQRTHAACDSLLIPLALRTTAA